MRNLTVEDVARLKRDAAELKSQKGIKQTHALAQIAQREGFSSWEALISTVGNGADVRREINTASPAAAERVRRAARYNKQGGAQ